MCQHAVHLSHRQICKNISAKKQHPWAADVFAELPESLQERSYHHLPAPNICIANQCPTNPSRLQSNGNEALFWLQAAFSALAAVSKLPRVGATFKKIQKGQQHVPTHGECTSSIILISADRKHWMSNIFANTSPWDMASAFQVIGAANLQRTRSQHMSTCASIIFYYLRLSFLFFDYLFYFSIIFD